MNLTIKDIPILERPRERLMAYGSETLSNIELLSIILKTGTKGESVYDLSKKLLNTVGSIYNLKNINKETLTKIKGIKNAKAVELLATIELGRRIFTTPKYDKKLLFLGTVNYSLVHPREIFKTAYLLSASYIVCIHNHPSGNSTPSKNDIDLTKKIEQLGNLHGIILMDHIIIGNDNYYSFFEDNNL